MNTSQLIAHSLQDLDEAKASNRRALPAAALLNGLAASLSGHAGSDLKVSTSEREDQRSVCLEFTDPSGLRITLLATQPGQVQAA